MSDIKKLDISAEMEFYNTTMSFLGANVPIEALCLPKKIENLLKKQDLRRIYDFRRLDLTKIKGLGSASIALLQSKLDIFLSMNI